MKPYHRNPRQITKKRYTRLADTLARLGDLSGIVHNQRTDEIIGGNQRTAVFGEASRVVLTEEYDQPDEQGTIAHGFIIWRGKKYAYRLVDWDEQTAAEANLTANIVAGDWDWDIFANDWDAGKLMDWGFDIDLLTGWRRDAGALGVMLSFGDSLVWGDNGEINKDDRSGSSPWARVTPSGKLRCLIGDVEFGLEEDVVSLWIHALSQMRENSIREAAETWFLEHIL